MDHPYHLTHKSAKYLMRNWIDLFESSGNWPTLSFPYLLHVGSLDISQKRENSHEGGGLSVSMHPNAWKTITAGYTQGDTWKLTKTGNCFLNFHSLSRQQKEVMKKWGIENGFAEPCQIFRATYFDDELDQNVYQEFDSIEELEKEFEDNDDVKVTLRKDGFVGTSKLATRCRHSGAGWLKNPYDFIATIYADDILNLDGVWWQDKLNVRNYSAPRGMIFPDRVSSFKTEVAQPHEEDKV